MNKSVSWQWTTCLACTGFKQTERKKDEEDERQAEKKDRQTGKKESRKEEKRAKKNGRNTFIVSQLNDGQFQGSKSAPQWYRKQQLKQQA